MTGSEDTLSTRRPPRTPLGEAATGGQTAARVVQVVAGEYLLTVNPIDGSEVVLCPPDRIPAAARRTPEERAARDLPHSLKGMGGTPSARPVATAGTPVPERPLLERSEEIERLVRLLGRGRSVRVTGPSGSGRTALLAVTADRCVGLAPDGVIRLSGYRRTPADLLYDLYTAVYRADGHRPDRPRLRELVADVGAVVVLDDIEFGGAALEEFLASAPECAFLISATPEVAAPSPDSHLEEVFLSGLSKAACAELLERAVERPLTDEETAWSADLWFESEGLPLRFVQAAALLRHREVALQPATEDAERSAERVDDNPFDPNAISGRTALPSLAESAAPAQLLASRLSENAAEALAFAIALGGECPHQSHLPALVGDTHADAALAELVEAGLATPVGSHFRLAAGVLQQLTAGGDAGQRERSQAPAQHYAWWAGHPSVDAERVAAEADAILAAMSASRDGGHPSAAVLLAHTAAPAFAAALNWSAWERALRIGQEAARLAGEVGEEAYFHHELGVLALCTGNLERARTELEASIGMRGVLADRQGTIVGRRTLALVTDRAAGPSPVRTQSAEEIPVSRSEASPSPLTLRPLSALEQTAPTVVTPRAVAAEEAPGRRRFGALAGSKRNLVAAGAGAVLVAVLGTVVTIGATSGHNPEQNAPMNVNTSESATQDTNNDGDLPAGQPSTRSGTPRHAAPSGSPSHRAARSQSPAPAAPPTGATWPGGTGSTTSPTTTPPTQAPPSSPTTSPTKSTSPSPSSSATSPSSKSPVPPSGTTTAASGAAPSESVSGPASRGGSATPSATRSGSTA